MWHTSCAGSAPNSQRMAFTRCNILLWSAGGMMPDLQPQDIERVMHGNEDLMPVSHRGNCREHLFDLSRCIETSVHHVRHAQL